MVVGGGLFCCGYYVQCLEWDAYCWICHTEGSEEDCCCEVCPRLYHKKCLGMKAIVSCWVCPECEVSAYEWSYCFFFICFYSHHAFGTFITYFPDTKAMGGSMILFGRGIG